MSSGKLTIPKKAPARTLDEWWIYTGQIVFGVPAANNFLSGSAPADETEQHGPLRFPLQLIGMDAENLLAYTSEHTFILGRPFEPYMQWLEANDPELHKSITLALAVGQ